MEINETTTYLFSEVMNIYRSRFEKVMIQMGLHSGQVFILQLLYIEDGQSQIDLALKLNLSPPTINNMVKSLKNNLFVKCRQCKKDGRIMRVYLTEKSLEMREQINDKWLKFETDFLASLTATEKLILFQLLEKIKVEYK